MPDPFDNESDEQQQETPGKGNQDRAFERISQERDQLREQIAKLTEEVTAGKRAAAFDELGIDRKYSELYQGDVDTEVIKGWATKFGFVGAAPETSATPEAGALETPSQGTAPAEAAPIKVGEPPVVGGKPTYEGKISVRDYQKLILDGRTDEAAKAYNEGRVEILTGGKFTGGDLEE